MRDAKSDILRFVSRIPFLVVALCFLFVLPWLLALPKEPDAAYAFGWNIGIASLVVFPFIVVVVALGFGWYHRLNLKTSKSVWGRRIIWTALVLFVGAQAVAWSFMLA